MSEKSESYTTGMEPVRVAGFGGLSHQELPINFALIFAMLVIACFVSRTSLAQSSVNIFGNAVPQTPVDTDTSAVTLGVKFWSAKPGTISGVRFYRGAKNSNGYTVKLFSAGGSLLASARRSTDTCAVPCWEQVNFASPLSLAANTTYIAAYYTSNGRYAGDNNGLANGKTNGVLTAPASSAVGGNGVYTYSTGFPNQTWQASNYYVDVSFTPTAATPSLVLSFNPPNPSLPDNSPIGTLIATAVATWSDGSQFTGTYALVNSDNGLCAISGNRITLGAALPANHATQNCIVNATQ